ncbi:hypothetical protein Tco_0605910 [Tanacetum coccineum]
MNSPPNHEWEEGLDIDDSDLRLTHVVHPSNNPHIVPKITTTTQTLFSSQNNQVDNCGEESVMYTQEYIRKVIEDVGEDDDFTRAPWLSVFDYVNVDGGIMTDNIIYGINIDDLTIEQYLRLTQENQTPSMVKKSFEEELSSEEDLDEWLKAEMEKHMSKQNENNEEDALIAIIKSIREECRDTRNYDTIDPQNEIAGQINPLLDKGGLTKRWHVSKPVKVFYDDGSGKDCGMWPTCDPDLSFRYGYKEVYLSHGLEIGFEDGISLKTYYYDHRRPSGVESFEDVDILFLSIKVLKVCLIKDMGCMLWHEGKVKVLRVLEMMEHESGACIYGALVSIDTNDIFSNNKFPILDVGRKIISKDNGRI